MKLTLTGGTLAGSGTLNASTDYDVQSGTISAALGGTVGFTKTGAGTVTLSGNNSYTGTTTVTGGTLRLGASNILSDSSNLTINGGTFDISSYNERVNVITMTSGTLLGSTGTLTGTTYISGGSINATLSGGSIVVGNGTTTIASIGSTTSLTVNGTNAIASLPRMWWLLQFR
jgi:autotransporter-associated beta strand protein